jgi:hypothetical protein
MRRLSPSSSCCPRICETRSGPSFSPYLSGKFNISMAKAQIFRIGECSCKTMAALSCVPNPLTLPLGLIFALDYAYITFHDPNLCEPVPSSTRRPALSLSLSSSPFSSFRSMSSTAEASQERLAEIQAIVREQSNAGPARVQVQHNWDGPSTCSLVTSHAHLKHRPPKEGCEPPCPAGVRAPLPGLSSPWLTSSP